MDYIPITILGKHHLLYVSILVSFGILLFFNPTNVRLYRQRLSTGILIVNLLQQCLLYGYFIVFDSFTIAASLPLHLSRITSILIIIFLITKHTKLFAVIAYFSLFAWLSFLVPADIQPINHPLGISFITNHVITLLFPFYMIIAYQWTPSRSDKYLAYTWLSLYIVTVYFLNPILDGNYFYLVDKPIFKYLPDIFYLVGVYIVGFLLFIIGEQLYKKVYHYYNYKKNDSLTCDMLPLK